MVRFAVLHQVIASDPYNQEDDVAREGSQEVRVNAACVRAFYARKENKPGTRITFNDGGGFAVTESPTEVEALLIDSSR